MPAELRSPILVLGNTRSGTTVVQRVMGMHPGIVEWYEPRTLWLYADPRREHDEFDESDVTEEVRQYIRDRFLAYQKQHDNRRILEKTPANILKIPYVRAIFPEATYVFIVRNPFSFISSVELKWQRTLSGKGIRRRLQSTPVTQLHHYAGRFIRQYVDKKILGRKYQVTWGPRYPGMAQDLAQEDIMTVIARQWAVCSRKAEAALADFEPGRVLRLRYEDFVTDPISNIERVAAHCGVEVTTAMISFANGWVKPDRQEKWRRFDPCVLARLLPEIEDEMKRHGYEVPPEIDSVRDQRFHMTTERMSDRSGEGGSMSSKNSLRL